MDFRRCHLLIGSYYLPQPNCDSYSRRLYHFVEFLLETGCTITCVASNPKGRESAAEALQKRGVGVYVGIEEHLDSLLLQNNFDWALLGFWHIGEPLLKKIRMVSPDTRIIIDSGDLHFLRHSRRILKKSLARGGELGEDYAWDMVRELNSYAAADAVFAVSEKEARLIGDFIDDLQRTFAIPDTEDFEPSGNPFPDRNGMFCVGNFEHPPNVEALAYLCNEILPHVDPALLEQHPIHVAGSNMSQQVRDLAADWPSVKMLGWVPSVVPYFERVRISLVPLLHGAGTKRKMIQALLLGTPTVTTTIGIEGLELVDECDVLVADDPVRFAAGITRLLTDEELWNALAHHGREHVLAGHSHAAARTRLLAAMQAVRTLPPLNGSAPASQPAGAEILTPSPERLDLNRHARDVIRRCTPGGSRVAILSDGDDSLVRLVGRTGLHFPPGRDGNPGGIPPRDSGEAIALLTGIQEAGAAFLAVPAACSWWHSPRFEEFREHLLRHCRLQIPASQACAVFRLADRPEVLQPLPRLAALGWVDRSGSGGTPRFGLPFQGLDDRCVVHRFHDVPDPRISVILPTRNRESLLTDALESLTQQGIDGADFEVIVVNDGSSDGTTELVRSFRDRLPLTLVDAPASGIAIAKNFGTDLAAAPLLLFFDDDDVAAPGLLKAHLDAHHRYPLEHVAVLGFTDWHPALRKSEVMRFVTEVGSYLFTYAPLRAGQLLDYTYFWGGRSSCKKSLLRRAGGFRPDFTFGSEDIEAGYRMSRLVAEEHAPVSERASPIALTVVYCPDALQHMNRPITYDEFCQRCLRQGRSQWQYSRHYTDPHVHAWCGVIHAPERWAEIAGQLPAKVARVHELEPLVEAALPDQRSPWLQELHDLYWWTFEAFKLKGIMAAAGGEGFAV
jgi:glycosyltransferase involved in cell wall biosynthesis